MLNDLYFWLASSRNLLSISCTKKLSIHTTCFDDWTAFLALHFLLGYRTFPLSSNFNDFKFFIFFFNVSVHFHDGGWVNPKQIITGTPTPIRPVNVYTQKYNFMFKMAEIPMHNGIGVLWALLLPAPTRLRVHKKKITCVNRFCVYNLWWVTLFMLKTA